MFDDIKCRYPLPVEGANDFDYQTKDTFAQYMDRYEIREDGSLWHEDYDTKDQSELTQWKQAHPNEEPPEKLQGIAGISGLMTRVNKRWQPVFFTGEIRFYTTLGKKHTGWIEWSSYFVAGKLNQIHLIEHRKPDDLRERGEPA